MELSGRLQLFFSFAMNLSGQSFTSHNELIPEMEIVKDVSFLFF